MTVCIAAFCNRGQTLVLAADKMLSLGFTSGELAVSKVARIHQEWVAMIAGNDIAPAMEILLPVKNSLAGDPSPPTDQVVRQVVDSFRRVRMQKVEALYLKSRGWSIEEFKSLGHQYLPDAQFREIDTRIQHFELELTILLAGFGPDGGIIATVENPGISTQQDFPGFHSIGSGDFHALSVLYERECHIKMQRYESIFYVYEAKIAAENAGGVGYETDLFVLPRGGKLLRVPELAIQKLESLRQSMARRDMTPNRSQKAIAATSILEEVEP